MAYERFWAGLSTTTTSAGTSVGKISVTSTAGFFVKQHVVLTQVLPSVTQEYIVQRVTSGSQLELGPVDSRDISARANLTAFVPGAILFAKEQKRNPIPLSDIDRAVYQEEPAVALRTLAVDQFGTTYGATNPFPIANAAALITVPYDSGTVAYPDPVTEVYSFKQGGISGTVVAIITLIYVDSTKARLASWEKT
jgi:hypothetical protein